MEVEEQTLYGVSELKDKESSFFLALGDYRQRQLHEAGIVPGQLKQLVRRDGHCKKADLRIVKRSNLAEKLIF